MEHLFRRKTSLTIKLVLSFMLVAVPPMLIASHVATQIVTSIFNETIEYWLTETSRYAVASMKGTRANLQAVQTLLYSRFTSTNVHFSSEETKAFRDLNVDIVLLSDNSDTPLFTFGDFSKILPEPLYENSPLHWVTVPNGQKKLAIVHTRSLFGDNGDKRTLVLGNWLNLGVGPLSSSNHLDRLELRIFTPQAGDYVQVYSSSDNQYSIPPDALAALKAGADTYFIPDLDWSDPATDTYFLLTPLRKADGDLEAIFVNSASMSNLKRGATNDTVLFWTLFFVGMTLSCLGGYIFAKHLVRPIKNLNEGVKNIAAGDFSYQVAVSGNDEVTELSAGFNMMAKQLDAMQRAMAQSARHDRATMLGEIALGFAHEIRNPLVVIKTSAEVVYNKVAPDLKERKLLGFVIEEVGRIDHLISQFLAFARPSPPHLEAVILADLLAEVADISEAECVKRNIHCVVQNDTPDSRIMCDTEQVRQVLLNLILNAMDAMPKGGRLLLRLYSSPQNGFICLDVTDTGQGISAALLPTIHMPFVTTKKDGLGLGLAKTYAIIEEHGGIISCASKEGEGTTFTIKLKM